MNNLEKITSGSNYHGQTCQVCQEDIFSSDEVVVCPRCRTVHHADCWKAKGGCGKTGCPQVAQAVKGERPQGDGPPPPISKWVILGGAGVIIALILLSVFWPKPPDPAMGRTKIVFYGEAFFELNEELTTLTEEFNTASEDIYIDLQLLPPGAADQKLIVLIAAGEAPDIIALSEERFDYLKEQDALLALDTDPEGNPIYGIQHPAQLAKLVIWGGTKYPDEAKQVLNYFLDRITPIDLDLLRELDIPQIPFGF